MAYIGVQPTDTYLSIASQQITGTGSATYTLDYSVSTEEDVAVFVNNVRQNVSTYTVSGTSLTLGGTISASDSCWVLFLGRTVGTKTPAVGSVTNDMLAGSIATSKLADGSTFATTNGITEADNWRVTTDFTPSGLQVITSNWERVDTDAQGYIGTGMTESSGIFTFPSTGYYLVQFHAEASHTAIVTYITAGIEVTTDNSSYSFGADANTNFYANGSRHYVTTSCMKIVDVTDTSLVKVRFSVQSAVTGVNIRGNSNSTQTSAHFIRLGDT
jgi:hypothetical protein